MFSDLDAFARKTDPSPQKYEIAEKWTKQETRATAIGVGHKTDFTKESRGQPGPIYQLSGFTDKFTETKVKNIGRK